MKLTEILRRVMAYGLQPPFRPQVPSNQAPSSWMEIMAGCLEERPEDRMTFANINLEMKKLSKGRYFKSLSKNYDSISDSAIS